MMKARWRQALLVGFLALALQRATVPVASQDRGRAPEHARAVRRLLIRNAMVIYGNARPAFGPADILIEDGLIARVYTEPGQAPTVEAVIDATGKYVMPGIVNTHMHWHEERAGIPQPIQYERNLYLASGVTTARELGGEYERSKQWRAQSAAHSIVAPRILVYERPDLGRTASPQELRASVRRVKETGGDGLKLGNFDRDQLEAVLDEAHKLGLPTTTHIGVEETTAKDYIELGVNAIEHFYGIPDAALDGVQDFPPDMNYNNEVQRFARAGELWAQANPQKLTQIIDLMVEKHVGWSPTLSVYEASRDVIRSQNAPWFRDFLHPAMEEYWKPNLLNHGSYFIGWTSTQETRWKKNYRVWMEALRDFGTKGGLITTGDDAGYIYSLYGFGIVRELEMQEEAGFHPLDVIKHATANGAEMIGMADRIGRVRVGFIADLLVVNGNPLENLRVLSPYGADMNVGDRNVHGGGIEWTIKDGIPYHVPTLVREIKEMVTRARSERARTTAGP